MARSGAIKCHCQWQPEWVPLPSASELELEHSTSNLKLDANAEVIMMTNRRGSLTGSLSLPLSEMIAVIVLTRKSDAET